MRYILNVDDRVRMTEETMHKIWKLPRYVYFSGEFSEETCRKFREELEAAEDQALTAKQDVIPIVIDSYGGSVYALNSMIDAIEACSLPVATIVESKAMSCGAILFAMGAEGYRYIGPNATVMIHPVSTGTYDKIHELKARTSEGDRLNDLLFKKMDKQCGHPEGYFMNLMKEHHMADWFLDANEAKRHNLANHIKIPKIQVDVSMTSKFG
jgi:ATP-dependent Clp protease protease subunit